MQAATPFQTFYSRDLLLRNGTDNGDAKNADATPHVIRHQGRNQLISPAAVATTASVVFPGANGSRRKPPRKTDSCAKTRCSDRDSRPQVCSRTTRRLRWRSGTS